jgi:hypothetical protein
VVLNEEDLGIAREEMEGGMAKPVFHVRRKECHKEQEKGAQQGQAQEGKPADAKDTCKDKGSDFFKKPTAHVADNVNAVITDVMDNIAKVVNNVTESLGNQQQQQQQQQQPLLWHRRHTCDGCGAHPIYGPRYRANELHDFDLCEDCYVKTTPKDHDSKGSKPVLTFHRIEGTVVPEQRGRKWGKWSRRGFNHPGNNCGQNGQGAGNPNRPAVGRPHFAGHPAFSGVNGCSAFPNVFYAADSGATVEQLVEEAIKRSVQDQKDKVIEALQDELARRNSLDGEITKGKEEAKKVAADAAAAAAAAATAGGGDKTVDEKVPKAAEGSSGDTDGGLDEAKPTANAEDEWSVVECPVTNDEVLARAAELMGSALWSSQEMNATASPEQLQRYAAQLTPLIELGFVDKYGMKLCVQILESLTAANIGSGELAEVSVDAVIQALEKMDEVGEGKTE